MWNDCIALEPLANSNSNRAPGTTGSTWWKSKSHVCKGCTYIACSPHLPMVAELCWIVLRGHDSAFTRPLLRHWGTSLEQPSHSENKRTALVVTREKSLCPLFIPCLPVHLCRASNKQTLSYHLCKHLLDINCPYSVLIQDKLPNT